MLLLNDLIPSLNDLMLLISNPINGLMLLLNDLIPSLNDLMLLIKNPINDLLLSINDLMLSLNDLMNNSISYENSSINLEDNNRLGKFISSDLNKILTIFSNYNLSIRIENSVLQSVDDILSPPVNPITGEEIDEFPQTPRMMAEMTVPRLRQVLEHLGLRTDGSRPVLLCRLRVHVGMRAEPI